MEISVDIKWVVSVVASACALAWALWSLVVTRAWVWNLQISVQPKDYAYGSLRLLVLRIGLKNIGKVRISPSPNGCRITVREIPSGKNIGTRLEPAAGLILLPEVDILRTWWRDDIGYANYEIEPGCEYHEILNVVVEPGKLLEVKVVFNWQGMFPIPFFDFRRRRLRWGETDQLPEYHIVQVGGGQPTQ